MIHSESGELSVQREVRYIHGSQSDLDQQYGWGMRWAAGRK
jgi:tellurite resistance protein TerA